MAVHINKISDFTLLAAYLTLPSMGRNIVKNQFHDNVCYTDDRYIWGIWNLV